MTNKDEWIWKFILDRRTMYTRNDALALMDFLRELTTWMRLSGDRKKGE